MCEYVLEMREIKKSFAVPVLKNVNFTIKKGEIHALVGGNGAGKSTLMKIMTGVYSMDSGEIFIQGRAAKIHNVQEASQYGVSMIFQELSLIHTMTVAENIFLGDELTKNGFLDKKEMIKKAKEVLDNLGIHVDPNTVVGTLSVGMSQMIEIAKAVSKNAKILVLDEPTASLSTSETEYLFRLISDLKKRGVSMVYISHRMNEILKVADRITILRDGFIACTEYVKNLSLEAIITNMLGSGRDKKFEWVERTYGQKEKDLLTVENLYINEKITDLSFTLKKGEILGFAGLMGSGRTEILEALFGKRKKIGGIIKLKGKTISINNTKDAIKAGFVLIPEDRRRQGLVLKHTVKDNVILPIVSRICKYRFFINEKQVNAMVEENVKNFGVVTDSINKRINLLSGGNQQKVVVAKWLNMNPEIIMLDEPTAGVDIGAKTEIIHLVRDFADMGKGVLFVSSELTELMAVCDRIIVLFDGKITKSFARRDINEEEELQHAIQQEIQ